MWGVVGVVLLYVRVPLLSASVLPAPLKVSTLPAEKVELPRLLNVVVVNPPSACSVPDAPTLTTSVDVRVLVALMVSAEALFVPRDSEYAV